MVLSLIYVHVCFWSQKGPNLKKKFNFRNDKIQNGVWKKNYYNSYSEWSDYSKTAKQFLQHLRMLSDGSMLTFF